MTAVLFVLTGVAAVGDWWAVWQRFFHIEYLLKPLTLLLLIAAAISADIPSGHGYVVNGLIFGLLGDIALMLSHDRPGKLDSRFLLGLTSFLAGNVCYLAAFARHGLHGVQLIAGALIVVGIAAFTLPAVLRRVHAIGGQELTAVVGAYATVLAAMAVLAVGTAGILTAAGAILFLGSDTVLARDRFVAPMRQGPLLVIVSYHLAQGLIVLGLIRR